jgi:hypothetical protein
MADGTTLGVDNAGWAYALGQVGTALNARQQAANYAAAIDRNVGRTKQYTAAEAARQKALTDENIKTFGDSVGLFQGDVSAEMGNRAADLRSAYAAATAGQPQALASAPQARDAKTQQAIATQNAAAAQRVNDLAAAIASLRSFSDVLRTKGQALGDNAGLIDQRRNFMRGSAGVLGSELQSAQLPVQAGNYYLGDALRGLGQLGMQYFMTDQEKLAAVQQGQQPTTPAVATTK